MNDDYWNAVSPGSKTAVIKTAIKRSFDEWMKAADAACEAKAGLSIHDLSDCPFMDWYEDGVSPSSAASPPGSSCFRSSASSVASSWPRSSPRSSPPRS